MARVGRMTQSRCRPWGQISVNRPCSSGNWRRAHPTDHACYPDFRCPSPAARAPDGVRRRRKFADLTHFHCFPWAARKACTGRSAQEKTMEIPQLKLLAAGVRQLLKQSQHEIGHNQSLDLIAAIPGLRNWPEVQAFPDRVAAAQLNEDAASRLAFRLNKKFNLGTSSAALLDALQPAAPARADLAPQIWPTGPAPGVYVTDSESAITALLERYEEATDGAVVYAEAAGSGWPASIDLGEGGLWSDGLERVPSGTLLVVGPVGLNQQMWNEESVRLAMACRRAYESRHRVAVLVHTPSPWAMCEDVNLMVNSARDDNLAAEILVGVVT